MRPNSGGSEQDDHPSYSRPTGQGGGAMTDRLRVLYDGSCPLCRAEIAYYHTRDDQDALELCDVSSPQTQLPEGLDRDAAMARFHVITADGQVVSGAAAFAALWAKTPGFRWLGWFARLPGICAVLELVYQLFLHLRPRLIPALVRVGIVK